MFTLYYLFMFLVYDFIELLLSLENSHPPKVGTIPEEFLKFSNVESWRNWEKELIKSGWVKPWLSIRITTGAPTPEFKQKDTNVITLDATGNSK